MKPFRFQVRTLLLAVIVAAVLIEIVGLGRRSRHLAAQAQSAAQAEQVYRRALSTADFAAAQQRAKADQLQSTDLDQSRTLRASAKNVIASIPFFEAQADRAAARKVAFERAMYRPWEVVPPDGQPPSTPPANP